MLTIFFFKVHRKLSPSESKGDLYETELLEQFADTDAAVQFFACLDQQLNKVNQFYRAKEKEFLERDESLNNQMQILVELKTALKQKHNKESSSHELKEEESISGTISCGMRCRSDYGVMGSAGIIEFLSTLLLVT